MSRLKKKKKGRFWNHASTSLPNPPPVGIQALEGLATNWSCKMTAATLGACNSQGSHLQLAQVLENVPATLCHTGPQPKGRGILLPLGWVVETKRKNLPAV